jgi:hypothetical protein
MSQKQTVNWKTRRIEAMNRILKGRNLRPFHEHFSEEHFRVCESKCKTKAEYKQQWRKNGHN